MASQDSSTSLPAPKQICWYSEPWSNFISKYSSLSSSIDEGTPSLTSSFSQLKAKVGHLVRRQWIYSSRAKVPLEKWDKCHSREDDTPSPLLDHWPWKNYSLSFPHQIYLQVQVACPANHVHSRGGHPQSLPQAWHFRRNQAPLADLPLLGRQPQLLDSLETIDTWRQGRCKKVQAVVQKVEQTWRKGLIKK